MKYAFEDPTAEQMLSAALALENMQINLPDPKIQATAEAILDALVSDYLAQCANRYIPVENGEYENSITLAAREMGMPDEERDRILKKYHLWHNPESRSCANCGRTILQNPENGEWVECWGEWDPALADSPFAACFNRETNEWDLPHAPVDATV